MRIDSRAPFEAYAVYLNFKKKEGRWYVTLVNRSLGSDRMMSYARYLLSVKLERELLKTEEADHVDGDKLNDDMGNLQLLSGKKNKQKSIVETGRSAKIVQLVCPKCGNSFFLEESAVRSRTKEGRQSAFCSRKCSGAHSARKRIWRPVKLQA